MPAPTTVDEARVENGRNVAGGPLAQAGAIMLCVLAAAVCFVLYPAATFQTRAVLVLERASTPLQTTLIRIAADTAVSKPVIDRAAAMLLATDIKAPAPDLAERLTVAAGATGATSRQARLADAIAPAARAEPGRLNGTLEIAAAAASPEQAARIADALAEAFVTQQDDAATQARLRQDEKAAARLDGAKATALAARQRLIVLGGVGLDPAQARDVAAGQTAAAETRLASIRAIMASGSPPLSDRKDLPPALAVPQAAYLDLKDQLARQGETLGERHTTIIALQDGVKRAAATLSAEWNRLKKIAEVDVVAAHEHETALRKANGSSDAKRHDAIEDARRAVQRAEDGVAAAERQRDVASDEATFRLVARAPVPKSASGPSLAMRLMLSLFAGLAGFALVIASRRLAGRRAAGPVAIHPIAPIAIRPRELVAAPPARDPRDGKPWQAEAPKVAQPPKPAALKPHFFDDAPEPLRVRRPVKPPSCPRVERVPVAAPVWAEDDRDLVDAMRAVLDAVEAMEPHGACRPTVMVAANEDGLETTSVALALGRAAADRGWQVLVVEVERAAPILAASADLDAEPVLIDLYGTLRVGLAADRGGSLFLAPVLRDGSRLARDLAKDPSTPLVDDLMAAFDLVVIDGGDAADASAAGWTADAFVRVATRVSRRDDDAFCALLEVAPTARIATVLPSAPEAALAPVPAPTDVKRAVRSRPVKAAPASVRSRAQPAPIAAPVSAIASPRRRIATR